MAAHLCCTKRVTTASPTMACRLSVTFCHATTGELMTAEGARDSDDAYEMRPKLYRAMPGLTTRWASRRRRFIYCTMAVPPARRAYASSFIKSRLASARGGEDFPGER